MSFLSKSRNPKKTLNRREVRRGALSTSRSVQQASIAYVERPVAIQSSTKPLVIWLGKDYDNLFADGSLYGFNCQWFNDLDLNALHQAKCIVVSCADTVDKLFNLVNSACEYGIPLIWLNRSLPPEVSYWSFDLRLNIKDSAFFWRDLCHLVK